MDRGTRPALSSAPSRPGGGRLRRASPRARARDGSPPKTCQRCFPAAMSPLSVALVSGCRKCPEPDQRSVGRRRGRAPGCGHRRLYQCLHPAHAVQFETQEGAQLRCRSCRRVCVEVQPVLDREIMDGIGRSHRPADLEKNDAASANATHSSSFSNNWGASAGSEKMVTGPGREYDTVPQGRRARMDRFQIVSCDHPPRGVRITASRRLPRNIPPLLGRDIGHLLAAV